MKDILLTITEVSITGSVLILLVLAMRLILRKAPKRIVCLLWLLVGIRLLVPFHIETEFSLQPDLTDLKAAFADVPFQEAGKKPPFPSSAMADQESAENMEPQDAEVLVADKISVVVAVWAAGVVGMLLYMAVSYLRLKRQVREAVVTQDGSWELDGLQGAFLFGYFKPRIYLPAGLDSEARQYVLSHEHSHIRRGDHWVKLIGFVCLAVHWFNPLVWVAYALLCRDLEMACDEQAVMNLTLEERKQYSEALLSCSGKSRNIAAYPIAFGETSVKERIKSILHYRKPGFWVILLCFLLLAATTVFLMTDATPKYDNIFEEYASMIGLPRAEFIKKLGFNEEDVVFENRVYCLPEKVEFNGTEYRVEFGADELTKDRVYSVLFFGLYKDKETFAEDLAAIESFFYNAYGETVDEDPVFTDAQQILDASKNMKEGQRWEHNANWEKRGVAPSETTQTFMDEMVTWDAILRIFNDRYGPNREILSVYYTLVDGAFDGNGENGGGYISVRCSASFTMKSSWEE